MQSAPLRIQDHHEVITNTSKFFHTKGGFVSKVPTATTVKISRPTEYEIPPDSFNSGALTNNPIYFTIKPHQLPDIELAVIEMDMANTDGSNTVTPVVAPYLIDKFRFYFSDLGTPQQTLSGDTFYNQLALVDETELTNFLAFNALNMTATAFAGETAIATNGKQTYSIPLLISVLNQLNPKFLKRNVILQVTPVASGVSAGTGTLVLSNIRLKLFCREEPHDESLHALVDRNPIIYPYVDEIISEQTLTLTASQSVDINLQLIGFFGAMLILIRSSKSVTASAIRTFAAIGGAGNIDNQTGFLDILDSNKVSIFGSGSLRPGYFRSTLPLLHGAGTMPTLVPSYWIPFGENNLSQVLRHGVKEGGRVMNNDHILRINCGSTFSTGTFTVTMIGYRFSELQQINGELTRTQF